MHFALIHAKIYLCILHLVHPAFWSYYFFCHAFYGANSIVKSTTSLNWNGSVDKALYKAGSHGLK